MVLSLITMVIELLIDLYEQVSASSIHQIVGAYNDWVCCKCGF